MPNLQDWQAYLKAHPEIAVKAPVQPKQIADLTAKAQMVVGHPGWQMFLDRIASRRELLVARRGSLERSILDGDGTGETAMKLELHRIKGALTELDFASEIIPAMVLEGEKMLHGLTTGETVADAAR